MITEFELDNIMVQQKDYIITRIDNGEIDEAICMLAVLHGLWCCSNAGTIGYGYKFNELVERINNEMERLDYSIRVQIEGGSLVKRVMLKKTYSKQLT